MSTTEFRQIPGRLCCMERWPLTGRTEEMAWLTKVIDDPEQPGVLVAGSAGVGKTRLLQEAAQQTTSGHVERVTATESARSLPFGAFAHLVPEGLGMIDRVDLLAVIGRHLLQRAQGRPALLLVDDIHLLDPLSAALVHHVAVARVATVLLTLRSGETAPDAVTALHRDGIINRMELQPISRLEFDQLVETALAGRTEGFTLDRMWHVIQGNILFARELIEDALEAGTLARHHGLWQWSGQLGVAPRLHETVAARLGALSLDERAFLEVLAVGEPLTLTSATHLGTNVSVPDLERRGLIVTEHVDANTIVRFAHPLFGETLRSTIPNSRRRSICRDLAEDLTAAADQQPGDELRLALLIEAAGQAAEPRLLTEAARKANVLSDHPLAERLARASIAGGGGFHAQLELGEALLGQGRLDEAAHVLTPLIGSESNDADRERLADNIALNMGYGLDNVDETMAILCSIEQDVTDPVVKALIQCHRATLLAFAARFPESADLGMVALTSVDDDAIRVRSLTSVSISLVMVGRIEEALTLSENAFAPALRLRDRFPRAPVWAMSSRASALFFAGRANESVELIDVAINALNNVPQTLAAHANCYRGRFQLSLGRARVAARLLDDAAATLRDRFGPDPSWCLALLAEAHALLGHHDKARAAAKEAVAMERRRDIEGFRPDQLRALAWVDAGWPHFGRYRTAVGGGRTRRKQGPTKFRDHHS